MKSNIYVRESMPCAYENCDGSLPAPLVNGITGIECPKCSRTNYYTIDWNNMEYTLYKEGNQCQF